MPKIKAIGLLSGGLDSTLALKTILNENIDVTVLHFTSPFCTCSSRKDVCHNEAERVAREMKVPIKIMVKGVDYVDVIRNPKYGHGKGINPCIDCRIYMLRRTKEYGDKIGAAFYFTGEVVGQRPMSQRINAMNIVEKESGMKGILLRPLSAHFFEPTIAEQKGWVNREHLLKISGRSRAPLCDLAESLNIADYPCPSGGCRLTDKIFAKKMKDLLDHQKTISYSDLKLLTVGRHFRLSKNAKLIIGRGEQENAFIGNWSSGYMSLSPNFLGPDGIIIGKPTEDDLKKAAEIMVFYSKEKAPSEALIKFSDGRQITIKKENCSDDPSKYNVCI